MYYSLCFDFWIDKKLQFNIHYGVFTNIIGLPGYREQNMSKIKKRYHVMKDVTHLWRYEVTYFENSFDSITSFLAKNSVWNYFFYLVIQLTSAFSNPSTQLFEIF